MNDEKPAVIRVAVVDDHPVARRGLEAMLTDAPDITVTASVASTADLLMADGNDQIADVILLDLYQHSDEPCLADIVRWQGSARVLVMSASGRPADVLGAIRAGAAGYLTKLADGAAVVRAVRTVAGGGFALSAKLADIVQAELLRGPAPDGGGPARPEVTPHLSVREEQTLELIAQGFTHAQAARRMGVTKATVDTYVERIRAKLQVGNKAELARAAMERKASGPGR